LTIVVHGSPESEHFALTFDDGPERGATDHLLDLLELHDVKATFFCVGDQIERDPQLAHEVLARGHEIGSHTQRHLNHHDREPEALQDFLDGVATLNRVLEVEPDFYRPPYGHFTHKVLAAAEQRRMRSVFWSSWGIDWLEDDADTIAARVFEDLRPGAIVLLHDAATYAPRSDCTPTIDAVGMVLTEAERRGLHAVTVGQLLEIQ
jgi:peptidoglycan/xylan/chitin deacetylase (PgdA/CDA1 family)